MPILPSIEAGSIARYVYTPFAEVSAVNHVPVSSLQTRQLNVAEGTTTGISRSTICYITGGAAVGLVLLGIMIGYIVRTCRRKRKIRERRKTRLAQREKIRVLEKRADFADPKGELDRSYSFRTTTSNATWSPQDERQRLDDRWKWNPPADPEKTAAAIRIPPDAKFF